MQFLETVIRWLNMPLLKAGENSISLLWILKLILALLSVPLITNLCKRLLRDYLLIRLRFSPGNREAIATLISYSFGALGFLIMLSANGLDFASLAVVLGGLGVGIGFGLQEITKNLVSGLTLILEGKLQVGDYIEFGGLSGYIKEIAMRSTIIRTFDGGDVVVPNSSLVGNQVLNWSYRNFTGKIRLLVGVAYDGAATGFSAMTKLSQFVSIRQLLKQVPYFQHTSDLHLRRVIEAGYRKTLSDSEALFHEGEMGNAVYIVLSGAIAAVSSHLNQTITTHPAGEFFGETPIMLGVPYLANAIAVGETSVFVIYKNSFEKLLQTCPKLSEVIAEELVKEQETYSGLRQQLQKLGLLNMSNQHPHFVSWLQTRLKQLFNISQ
jgi:CRP-like cAMP-binding protein